MASTASGLEQPAFYSGREYWEEMARRVSVAGPSSRIVMASMTFDPVDPVFVDLVSKLEHAGARGSDLLFCIDAHSFLVHNRQLGPLWYRDEFPAVIPKIFEYKRIQLQRLNHRINTQSVILNHPHHKRKLHLAGRSHIKLGVVNNRVYIGSHNMDHPEAANLTLGFEDAGAAEWLYRLMHLIARSGNVRAALHGVDQTYQVDPGTAIYVDAGVPGQSLIYKQALDLIDSAQQWLTITCQYFPNSVTAQHLLRAKKRGVKVEILYAHHHYQGFVGSLGQRVSQLIERSRLPRSMFKDALGPKDPMLHAKLIACDQGMMIGSHNYVRAGVKLGTAEIALQSRDAGLAAQGTAEVHEYLKRAQT